VAVAMAGEESAKCVSDTITKTTNVVESNFNTKFNGKSLTSTDKSEIRDYYILLMDSLKAYNDGGLEGINMYDNGETNSKSDSERAILQKNGLGMVNRAYVDAAMTSLLEMNKKYQFMDESSWKHIESLSIEGVDMSNIRNYNAEYFTAVREQAALKTDVDAQTLSKVDSNFKKSMKDELAIITQEINDNPNAYASFLSNTEATENKESEVQTTVRETVDVDYSEHADNEYQAN
jgi:hypothetical protein